MARLDAPTATATLRGVAASPGKARGRARVVTTAEELHEVETGDILVCRITAPSWAPVFSKIAAAVSDVGGIMAHTAIVSREYGLPAVVGTGFGTQRIATGQLVEVDGDSGVVRIVGRRRGRMSDAPVILWLDDAHDAPAAVLGGKFASLAEMTAAGFDVPPGFGITTAAYRALRGGERARGGGRPTSRTGSTPTTSTRSRRRARRIAARFEAARFPSDLEAAIRSAYAALGERMGDERLPVAVRSSGVSEDLAGASFAGQYDTFLWVMGADAVLAHVKRCWAGLFGPAVLTYRPGAAGAPAGPSTAMCVGVQADGGRARRRRHVHARPGDRRPLEDRHRGLLGAGRGRRLRRRHARPLPRRQGHARAAGAARSPSKEQEHRFDPASGDGRAGRRGGRAP